MKAAVLTVGTEILRGRFVNTNSAWLAQRLTEIGFDVVFQATVGDDLSDIVEALGYAGRVAGVVITTGGLGPTQDDLARESLAELTGRPLEVDSEAVEQLRAFFARRGFHFTNNNLKQASRPQGAELLENTCGTAPGIYLEHEGVIYIAVPGPPAEMQEMMARRVLPRLCERLGGEPLQRQIRRLRLCDIGESAVAQLLEDLMAPGANPVVASYASPGEVILELTARASSQTEALELLDTTEAIIRERLGAQVYAVGEEGMEAALGRALRESGKTIATAESCTGGLLASRITDVPGASDYFRMGFVTYSNESKRDLLGVSEKLLSVHGAVSEAVARAMAEGCRVRAGTDVAIAITGIAGPTGGTANKPVGLVYIAVADETGTQVVRNVWPGTRSQFKARVTQTALNLARKRVLGV
ncbi:MAG: competence/damage-inducible protein A [Candidatus Zipacnadales bacterium]